MYRGDRNPPYRNWCDDLYMGPCRRPVGYDRNYGDGKPYGYDHLYGNWGNGYKYGYGNSNGKCEHDTNNRHQRGRCAHMCRRIGGSAVRNGCNNLYVGAEYKYYGNIWQPRDGNADNDYNLYGNRNQQRVQQYSNAAGDGEPRANDNTGAEPECGNGLYKGQPAVLGNYRVSNYL